MATYRETAENLFPPWFRKPWGQAFADLLALPFDMIDRAFLLASYAHFLAVMPQDGIELAGQDRQIPIGVDQDWNAWRSLLIGAWSYWASSGTPGALIAEILRVTGWTCSIHEAKDYDPGDPYWARFVLFFDVGDHSVGPAYLWGAPDLMWGGGAVWGSSISLEQAAAITDTVKRLKPAHTRCEKVIFRLSGGSAFDYANPGTWGETVEMDAIN